MKIMHQGTMPGPLADPARYTRYGWATRRLYRCVLADARAAGLPAGARVLDVGTGPGTLPLEISAAEPGWIVDGLDLDRKMIEFARTRPGADRVTFTVGDAAKLPFPDATFDLIVSTLSQHHWPDVPGSLRDLRRVLRPAGRLYIYDAFFALHAAETAAKTAFGDLRVRRNPVPTPTRLFARLDVECG